MDEVQDSVTRKEARRLQASFQTQLGMEARASMGSCLCCCAHGPPLRAHSSDPKASVHKFMVGDICVHVLTDGAVTIDATNMFPSVPRAELAAAFPNVEAVLSFGCTLLRTPGGLNVLLDTSLGCTASPYGAASARVLSGEQRAARPPTDLRTLLAAVGITPADVSLVVHSHLHADHTGWNVVADGHGKRGVEPLFKHARHLVQRDEYEYWSSTEALRARASFDTNVAPLEQWKPQGRAHRGAPPSGSRGLLQLVDGAHEVCDGVALEPFAGHTPGHQIVRLASRGQCAYFVGDALHVVQQVAAPHWTPIFDWAPAQAAAVRVALLERLAREGANLFSPHFPFPGIGTVERVRVFDVSLCASFRFVPTGWCPPCE